MTPLSNPRSGQPNKTADMKLQQQDRGSMEEIKRISFDTPVHDATSEEPLNNFMLTPISLKKTADMKLQQQDRGSMEEIKKISFDTPVNVTTSRSLTPPLSDRLEKTADVRSKMFSRVNNIMLPESSKVKN